MNAICPIECRQGAIDILNQLKEAGHEAYFAGGCVRDRLLSSAPTEYDIATSARPEEVKSLFPKARSVGESFGVMLVKSNNHMYDVATFRSDGPYSDHRHPDQIQFSDAEHDALRRDFTINGMFEDPVEETIIDYVGGKEDIELRVVRAIGTPRDRIAEDHLRMLRAIRFAARFEFSIDSDTGDAIRDLAPELSGVSRERIGEEVRRMMVDPNRGVAAWELQYHGLDRVIFAEHSCMNAPTRLGRLPASSSFATALAAWIIDRHSTEADVIDIASRWRTQLLLANKVHDELVEILSLHQQLFTCVRAALEKETEMKNLITCLTVSVLSCTAVATTWTVDDDGNADFDNIQDAIDAASDGDEIIVMPGTYTSTAGEVVRMLGKAVWLHSSDGQEITIVDGEFSRLGIRCNSFETNKTVIEGFTIIRGSSNNGGGMYNDYGSPTLIDCTFENNIGGLYNNQASNPKLTNCTFIYNIEYGIRNSASTTTLTSCTFRANTNGTSGGGVLNQNGNITLANCTFDGNSAGNGGGMYNSSTATLTNCTFTNNGGGGIYSNNADLTVTDTAFCGNTPYHIYGDYTDGGGNDFAEACPVSEGVCCTNDNCTVSVQENCLAFFGEWQGGGTTCEDNPCPTPCLGDVTGDGQVDVSDILVIISVWGACP